MRWPDALTQTAVKRSNGSHENGAHPPLSTDSIRSRFGTLGPYAGTPLEDPGGLRRSPDSRPAPAAQSAELRMSGSPTYGPPSLAQGVQAGVAVAQAGLATSRWLEAAPTRAPASSSPSPGRGESGPGAAELRSQAGGVEPSAGGVPLALADMLARAPQAADALRDSGSDLQAWLDIATGRMALRAAQEIRGREQLASEEPPPEPQVVKRAPEVQVAEARPAPVRPPEVQQASSPTVAEGVSTPSAEPERALPQRMVSPAQVDDAPAQAPEPSQPSQPARAREGAEQRVRAALDLARRSFGTALERLDAQLEPALAAAASRLGGSEPLAAAESAAARMRSQPERSIETHTGPEMPGVLALLRWDFAPLTEPLPPISAARG